jgi:DNA-binding FadR family transcriptional regulator
MSDESGIPGLEPEARLGDKLYDYLTALINDGTFAAGVRLPAESALSKRFKVSRPLIREVLSRLRQNGLIVSRKGSGSFVQQRPESTRLPGAIGFAPITSLAQVRKCFEFRVGIEGEAAFWAARNRSAAGIEALRLARDRLEDAVARGTVGTRADYDFHVAVAQASANEFFETVLHSMRGSIEFAINLSRSLSLTRPLERLRIVQAEHEAILAAVVDGDGDAARLSMRSHIQNACNRVFEGSLAAGEVGRRGSTKLRP